MILELDNLNITSNMNSSQYNFQGTAVIFMIFSIDLRLRAINRVLPGLEIWGLLQDRPDLNLIRE